MNTKNKINNTSYIIFGALGTAFIFCFLLALFFIVKSYVKETELSKFGSAGDFFNGFITPFISSISAILIYIAFKQQVDSNKEQEIRFNKEIQLQIDANKEQTERFNKQLENDKADKKFERCLLLIQDVEKLENKILIRIIPPLLKVPSISSKGGQAIDDYIMWLKKSVFYEGSIVDYINFKKDLFVYLYNVSIILYYSGTLKDNFAEHFQILNAKVFLNNPRLYSQVKEMLVYKDIIKEDDTDDDNIGKGIIEQLQKIKNGLDKQSTKQKESDGKDKNK